MAQRILVIDDVAEMRDLIRRGMSASGYEVDVAATLGAALAMDPGSYDAVLVDDNLGAERGTDLIETLRAQDEAAVGRCLVITGGATDLLPEGVASLAKPFQMGALVAAVDALRHPAAAAEPHRAREPERAAEAGRTEPGQPASGAAKRNGRLPASVPPSGPATAEARAGLLLAIIRRLRARERREVADFLHDGPIQELTAASLELQLMQRSAPEAQHLASLQRRVDAVSGSLRSLVDEPWPLPDAETELTEAIARRTAWLPGAPASVDAGPRTAGLGADEAALVSDIAELMLLTTEACAPAARARVVVATGQQLQVDVILTPAAGDQAVGDPVAAQSALARVAAALGADLMTDFSARRWRVRLAAGRPE